MTTPGGISSSEVDRRLDALVEAYQPLPGTPDEFIDAAGRPRPHWLSFLRGFVTLGASELDRRFDLANRHMRELGVSYRAYGDRDVRPWPLSHMPLLIGEAEWAGIAEAVTQRATLIEALLADIYGPNRLVTGGQLPAAAVTGSTDFLRPLHGVRPAGGRYLNLYAADIGRGPDGRWWVLGDRTQAPSGSGYALENRLALSRAFPDLYKQVNVERLASFFQQFRSALVSQAERSDPRICLLTAGPHSETYFEQAYLARYLGFLLVEGGDLTMRDGQIHVRTIAGLKRADVIWRRIDADSTDPLELDSSSRIGVPGLVEAVRAGKVVVGNALGSGVVESRALMSFLPALAKHMLGAPLKMPNVATWWCGQPRQQRETLANMDKLALAGAFNAGVPGGLLGTQPVVGAALDPEKRQALAEALSSRGIDFVGQEVARLSTTPVWSHGRLVPRPFVLRVFATPTAHGWKVMPGGFCRIATDTNATAIAMGDGVQSTDVCVLADKPVGAVSLLPSRDTVHIRRLLGNLPSRAADNLFWLGRYIERSEATLRIVRCLGGRNLGPERRDDDDTVERLVGLLTTWGAIGDEDGKRPRVALHVALHDLRHFGSAASLARESMRTASVIQERLSGDATRLIGRLMQQLEPPPGGPPELDEAEAFIRADEALNTVAAVSGLSQENVNRVAGWRFLEMGRRIERASNTCRYARLFAATAGAAEDLDVLLDLIDSQITYRSRYLVGVALGPVRDMVVLDPFNPRSVAFQVDRIHEHLATLPPLRNDGQDDEPLRIARLAAADLAAANADSLDLDRLTAIGDTIFRLGQAIAQRYFLQPTSSGRVEKYMGLA